MSPLEADPVVWVGLILIRSTTNMASKQKLATAVTDSHVVIASDSPGFKVAKDIAKYGRLCRRLSACTCKAGQHEACFDWVKV